MFGITLTEFLLFLREFGIAIAGAASLWGLLFWFLSQKVREKREAALWHGASQKLLWMFFSGLFFYSMLWIILAVLECIFCVQAHEGISLPQTADQLTLSMRAQYPAFVTLLGFWASGLVLLCIARRFLLTHLHFGYGFVFLTTSGFLLYPWGGLASFTHVVSNALHSWHSILTLGSVIIIDFLYISLRHNLRSLHAKIFVFVTKGIWIGLGLDFLSAGLIFQEVFEPTAKLFFAQTLIAILIINGVMLSGPIARAILSFQEHAKHSEIPSKLHQVVGISGSISLASWITVKAIDGFRDLTLSYGELFGLYIIFIAAIFILRETFDHFLLRETHRDT